MPEQYDLIVIGSGQGGDPLARAFAAAGKKAALIERRHVGGSCVNFGCTPTKRLVHIAQVSHMARRAIEYGVCAGPVEVDMAKVRRLKRQIVREFRDGVARKIEKQDRLELIMGEARFSSPSTVAVDDRELTAPIIVIDTGTSPFIPPIDGVRDVPFLDNESVMELDELPEHLLILGGGYIGLEFGQMFRRFGSRVTIIDQAEHLMEREDVDVCEEVTKVLTGEGVKLQLGAKVLSARNKSGKVSLKYEQAGTEHTITGSHLLVAVGRVPYTKALNLSAAGVDTDEKENVKTNNRLETSAKGVYAIGDVNGGPAFTHISYDDFRILEANLLHGGKRTTKDRLVPSCAFIDPQLGRVGLSEKEAKEQGVQYRVAKLPLTGVARAIEIDKTQGFLKALVAKDSDEILGCAVLCHEGGEIMSLLQTAMMAKLPYTAIRNGVFAHPTIAESLNNLFMTLMANE